MAEDIRGQPIQSGAARPPARGDAMMARPEQADGAGLPALHDVCVVLLNFNGGSLVVQAVEAVWASERIRPALVVVDNGSIDGSDLVLEELLDRDPVNSLFLRTGANLGFAAGNNLALWSLPARAVCLLNGDALVDPGTLGALLEHLDLSPRVGACGPKLLWPAGEPQPFSHGHDPSPSYLLRRAAAQRRGNELHDWAGDRPRTVDWVAGTCMLLRTAALERVGLLDEGIFMYFEDNDLCKRLRARGFSIDFVPTTAVHHHNKPAKADLPRRRRYYQGLARFYDRYYGRPAGGAIRVASRVRLATGH
ncbi:MAG: glycosyltransferase family 2 protein [Chloroflexota bacterium]